MRRILFHEYDLFSHQIAMAVELALAKMNSGPYGKCELCGKSIPIKRLKVLPAARLCFNCAQKYEEIQSLRKHHRDEIIDNDLLEKYGDLDENNSSTKIAKLYPDKSLLNIEEVKSGE